MSRCKRCDGFVTDNYARVFGDNDDNVFECRNCRGDRRRGTSDEDDADGERVLLRTVRGGEDAQANDRAATATDDAGGRAESEPTPAVADGGVAAAADDGTRAASRESQAADRDDDDGRFGIKRFLSRLRS